MKSVFVGGSCLQFRVRAHEFSTVFCQLVSFSSRCWSSFPRMTLTTSTTWAVCFTRTASTRRPARSSPLPCKCWDTCRVLVHACLSCPVVAVLFTACLDSRGFDEPDEQTVCVPSALSYNIALCHYSLKMYPQALKHIEDIKNRGIKEHPGQSPSVL